MPTPIAASRNYRPMDLQHKVALDQRDAVNRRGERQAAGKKRSQDFNKRRQELLKEFSKGETVNNGKDAAVVVGTEPNPAVLVVKLASGKVVRWAPDFIEKGTPK